MWRIYQNPSRILFILVYACPLWGEFKPYAKFMSSHKSFLIFLQGSVDFGSEALSITGSGVGSTKSRERKEKGTVHYFEETNP